MRKIRSFILVENLWSENEITKRNKINLELVVQVSMNNDNKFETTTSWICMSDVYIANINSIQTVLTAWKIRLLWFKIISIVQKCMYTGSSEWIVLKWILKWV